MKSTPRLSTYRLKERKLAGAMGIIRDRVAETEVAGDAGAFQLHHSLAGQRARAAQLVAREAVAQHAKIGIERLTDYVTRHGLTPDMRLGGEHVSTILSILNTHAPLEKEMEDG
jgi:hypothetical protein